MRSKRQKRKLDQRLRAKQRPPRRTFAAPFDLVPVGEDRWKVVSTSAMREPDAEISNTKTARVLFKNPPPDDLFIQTMIDLDNE